MNSQLRKVGWRIVKAEDVLDRLRELGISIDRRTLNNYVKWKLITAPEHRSGGKGVCADYPEHAVAEAATAAELMQQLRWTKEQVATARQLAVEIDGTNYNEPAEVMDALKLNNKSMSGCDIPPKGVFKKIWPVIMAVNATTWWTVHQYYKKQEAGAGEE